MIRLTGKVHGMTAARHTSLEFIAFLEGLVGRTGWEKEIHVVLDNLSAHKTKDVERFLAEHPRVRFPFTPTYSSWLNQVELWFAKIQRDVIARGVFRPVADLGNKLRKYIRAYSQSARPFRWTYTHPSRCIIPNKIAGHLTSPCVAHPRSRGCDGSPDESQANSTKIPDRVYWPSSILTCRSKSFSYLLTDSK